MNICRLKLLFWRKLELTSNFISFILPFMLFSGALGIPRVSAHNLVFNLPIQDLVYAKSLIATLPPMRTLQNHRLVSFSLKEVNLGEPNLNWAKFLEVFSKYSNRGFRCLELLNFGLTHASLDLISKVVLQKDSMHKA